MVTNEVMGHVIGKPREGCSEGRGDAGAVVRTKYCTVYESGRWEGSTCLIVAFEDRGRQTYVSVRPASSPW